MKTLPLYELKKLQTNFVPQKMTTTRIAAHYIRQFYGDDIEVFESVFVLLVNNQSATVGYAKISQGGITGATVDIRIICKYAIESLAVGVIIAHNHPSGKLEPSKKDLEVTKKLKSALKNFDIMLLDHIILTADGHYSMKDNDKI